LILSLSSQAVFNLSDGRFPIGFPIRIQCVFLASSSSDTQLAHRRVLSIIQVSSSLYTREVIRSNLNRGSGQVSLALVGKFREKTSDLTTLSPMHCSLFHYAIVVLAIHITQHELRRVQSTIKITSQPYGAEHYSRDSLLLGHSIVSQHFMEPEGSIPNSQELSTCPYLEPDQSSPSLQDPS
jgi:hypothetical protein